MKFVTKEKLTDHPLEDVFDIEENSTIVEYTEPIPSELVEMPAYDAKDNEIEGQLEEIYTIAISGATTTSDEIERVEGKYKARIAETTAGMLNVALGAVREKRELKKHKDSQVSSPGTGTHTTNNNLIVADRNELLRMLIDKQREKEQQ